MDQAANEGFYCHVPKIEFIVFGYDIVLYVMYCNVLKCMHVCVCVCACVCMCARKIL
jgi:hypothetical protein